MKNVFLWSPVVIYLVVVTIIFIKSLVNKEANTADKVAKGTNNYAGFVILFTILGTMIGPGYSYGAIEEFYKYGFYYTQFFILAVISFWLFGHCFAGKIKKIGVGKETAGDILTEAYGKSMQILVGFLTFAFSVAIIAVLGKAGSNVISSVTSLDATISIIAVILFITIYSFWGGIATVIKTDVLQFIFVCLFCLVGVGVAIYLFFTSSTTVNITTFIFNTKGMPVSEMINISFAFLLGEAFLPVYTIRGMIAKDENTAKKAFKKAAYIGVIWFLLLTVIGISAHYVEYNPDKLVYLNLIQSTLQGTWWGTILIGGALAGMLSVVMSTIDSILNAAGVSFRKDIMQQLSSKIANDNSQQLLYSRFAILLVAILGIICAIRGKGIVSILIIAYSIWVPAVVFPFAYYLIKNKINNKWSGFVGALSGIVTWILFAFVFKTSIPPVLIGLIVNVVAFLAIEKLWKKKL